MAQMQKKVPSISKGHSGKVQGLDRADGPTWAFSVLGAGLLLSPSVYLFLTSTPRHGPRC